MNRLVYDELDKNIRSLVAALNDFPGVQTIGSCGGHECPGLGGWKAPDWYVKFTINRTDEAWLSLEFLAWAINRDGRGRGQGTLLIPDSAPPYLNEPGRMLHFALEGSGDPEALAAWVEKLRGGCFVLPAEAASPQLRGRVRPAL